MSDVQDTFTFRPSGQNALSNDSSNTHRYDIIPTIGFTPINQQITPSAVSGVVHDPETPAAAGFGRKRARSTPTNLLVADYLGINSDALITNLTQYAKQSHPLAANRQPKRRRANGKSNSGLAVSVGRSSRRHDEGYGDPSTDDTLPIKARRLPTSDASLDVTLTVSSLAFTTNESQSSQLRFDHVDQSIPSGSTLRESIVSTLDDDDFDLDFDDGELEELVRLESSNVIRLPKTSPIEVEAFADAVDYMTDYDSDELTAICELADSGCMSSSNKSLVLTRADHSDQLHAPTTTEEIWYMSDDSLDEGLIDLTMKVDQTLEDIRSATRKHVFADRKSPSAMYGLEDTVRHESLSAGYTPPRVVSPYPPTRRVQHLPDSTSGSATIERMQDRKRIVRNPSPEHMGGRSPVLGASNDTVLRRCFRVGEALNISCQAARSGQNIVLELYARVTASWREPGTTKQHLVLADLYHGNPPYIDGTYEAWKGVPEWDEESARFLGASEEASQLCRCVGSMKKDRAKWKMAIHIIRLASWDEVEHTAGIYCS
ncbi:hypothetical protein MBLNU459_g8402t1 [Dothideomycetes sp. NU459]